MTRYWSWSGRYIGARHGDFLHSATGMPVGMFIGNELYDSHGRYIGEIMDGNRIIVNKNNSSKCGPSKSIPCGPASSLYSNIGGNAMLAGHEDFCFAN